MTTVKISREFIITMGASGTYSEIVNFCKKDLCMKLVLGNYGIDATKHFTWDVDRFTQEFIFKQEPQSIDKSDPITDKLNLILKSLKVLMKAECDTMTKEKEISMSFDLQELKDCIKEIV